MGFATPVVGISADTVGTYLGDGATVKFCAPAGSGSYSIQKAAGESVGLFTLTLEGLVVGSAVRVERAGTGAAVEFRTAASSTEVFSVPALAPGDPGNALRIKVRKATAAPFFIPFETQTTAFVGAQSLFVSQIPDQ